MQEEGGWLVVCVGHGSGKATSLAKPPCWQKKQGEIVYDIPPSWGELGGRSNGGGWEGG